MGFAVSRQAPAVRGPALVAGSSGLVGGQVLDLLLEDLARPRVVSFVRRPQGRSHARLVETTVDFERLSEIDEPLEGADVFCALGTTIAKAGSEAAFRKVDFDAIVALARLAKDRGAAKLLLVSSLGADSRSRVFYSRVKGETEEAVTALGLPALFILRPSLLLGKRAEPRTGERIGAAAASAFSFAFVGPLRRYRPIESQDVARAMLRLAEGPSRETGEPRVRILESEEIQEISEVAPPKNHEADSRSSKR